MLLSTKIVITSRSTDLSAAAGSAMGHHITQVPHLCTATKSKFVLLVGLVPPD